MSFWQQQHFEQLITRKQEVKVQIINDLRTIWNWKTRGQVDTRCNISSSVRVDLRCQHLPAPGNPSAAMTTVVVAWGAEEKYHFSRRGGALDVNCHWMKYHLLDLNLMTIEWKDSFFCIVSSSLQVFKSLDSNACRPPLQLRCWAGKRRYDGEAEMAVPTLPALKPRCPWGLEARSGTTLRSRRAQLNFMYLMFPRSLHHARFLSHFIHAISCLERSTLNRRS